MCDFHHRCRLDVDMLTIVRYNVWVLDLALMIPER